MSRMMIQAATTMNQLQRKLDVVAHNLANSQTTGYKSRQTEFSSLLFQQVNNLTNAQDADNRLTPGGIRVGSGARLGAIEQDLSIGAMKTTDRVLDTALQQESYLFQVQVSDQGVTETRYTRDGAFYLNPVEDGQTLMLTTKDGDPVLGQDGPIIVQAGFDSISIGSGGQVVVQNGSESILAGNIQIVETVRPELLEAVGQNYFRLPDLEALEFDIDEIIQEVIDEDALKSGVLEQSNVALSEEMTEMILAQRSYQFNARTITMADQMFGLVNQLR